MDAVLRLKFPAICNRLLGLSRYAKRTILVAADFTVLVAVLWAGLSLRYRTLYVPPGAIELLLPLLAAAITIATYGWFGLYRLVTRFINRRGMWRIVVCTGLSVLFVSLVVLMAGQHGFPRSVIAFYAVAGSLATVATRQLAALLLKSAGIEVAELQTLELRPVLIYGAGRTALQLLEAVQRVGGREVVGFVDPSPTLWGQYVGGVKVHRPAKLGRLIERSGVKEVLLAMPQASRRQRRLVVEELDRYPVEVKILPAMEEIVTGRVRVSSLRPVGVADLLGRDPVPACGDLLSRSIRGKSVLVTGAGGSIGSELVRQILKQAPRRLVLFDMSEPALAEIEREISANARVASRIEATPEIVCVLGSVLDSAHVANVIRKNEVQCIYHAAAYKHVPIVEQNPAEGLKNNTLGTAVVAAAARALKVERFVLISTDKAVRPTSVMGASKRLAELVLQAHDAEGSETIFTMVRFGNVLDSSGSVVGRFRRQIEAGGPVTVTHPEMIRYFMSIPEAAELVIQAGAMAQGGEVFVLDMGEPVKILDLARMMIRLMGHELRSEDSPEGDITIEFTGLRPGEKLHEELLVTEGATGTEHPRIMQAIEPFLPMAALRSELELLQGALERGETDLMLGILARTVEGYRLASGAMATAADGMSVPPTLH